MTDKAPSRKKSRMRVRSVIGRILLSVGTLLILLVITLFVGLSTVANGPSTTLRDALVLSAIQASATKWVPGLFLDEATVKEIVENSKEENKQSVDLNDFVQDFIYETTPDGDVIVVPAPPSGDGEDQPVDEWANAIDGMKYFTMSGTTYKAYVLLVRDPSRVYVATSSDFKTPGVPGLRIFDIVEKEGCVAAINGGEFYDPGGAGIGERPLSLTYSKGECVYSHNGWSNFFGFDKNNKLIVRENISKEEADALGIRDAVSFQWGNVLIDNKDGKVNLYYAESNTARAQRTAIGQRADGTVILVVTDGRTGSSLGATHDDMVNLMVSLGAISAGNLDGGSSTVMYYEKYFEKYNLDTSNFDSLQLKGLVNKYKAFVPPRRMPTFFAVKPE